MLLVALWLGSIANGYSVFPTNTYGIYNGWYEPGNAIKVKNHYSLDFNAIYLPWKLYLAAHSSAELSCQTSASPFTLGHQGVKLPDQSCFPLATSRLYTMIDPRRWLEKVLPFFVAYDLGYLCLALLIWLAVFILLAVMQFKSVPLILGAAVSLGTFWISKELQYDQYSAPIPFLYIGLACLVGMQHWRASRYCYLSFGLSLFLALLLTSLQGILLCGIIFTLIMLSYLVARNGFSGMKWRFWKRYGQTILFVYVPITLLMSSSFSAFFANRQEYVSALSLGQEINLMLKRAILPLVTPITIPTANLLGNFDTIDPWKALGWFGGREYVSIDTLTLYCGSLYAILLLFIICLNWCSKKNIKSLFSSQSLRFLLISLGGAWLLCFLPTYKFFYFRLLQFTIGFGAPIFVALALEEITNYSYKDLFQALKRVTFIKVGIWTSIFLLGYLSQTNFIRGIVLRKLGTGGTLGFEPGLWEFRYQRFSERLLLQDSYAISLVVVQVVLMFSLYLYIGHIHRGFGRRSQISWITILLIVQIVMVFDNSWHTWNWNWPQKTQLEWIVNNPYWSQKGVEGLKEVNPAGAPTPHPNFLILYDQTPPYFYESLQVKPIKKIAE